MWRDVRLRVFPLVKELLGRGKEGLAKISLRQVNLHGGWRVLAADGRWPRSGSPRRGTGCRAPGPSRRSGAPPSRERASAPCGIGTWTSRSTSVSDRSRCGSYGRVQSRLFAGHDEDGDGRSRVAFFACEGRGWASESRALTGSRVGRNRPCWSTFDEFLARRRSSGRVTS